MAALGEGKPHGVNIAFLSIEVGFVFLNIPRLLQSFKGNHGVNDFEGHDTGGQRELD